jgi:hypothetical protein
LAVGGRGQRGRAARGGGGGGQIVGESESEVEEKGRVATNGGGHTRDRSRRRAVLSNSGALKDLFSC